MNQDQFAGSGNQMKGAMKETCGRLTDDDLAQVQGKRDQLAGRLQARYGRTAEEIEREVDRFLESAKTEQNRR